MTRFFLEAILQVIVLIPFSIFLLKKRNRDNYLRIFFFATIYVVYQIVLILPKVLPSLNLIDSRWNWEGKILGIFWGITCYFVFRKYFADNDFFTLRQNKENFRISLMGAIFVVIAATVIGYFSGSSPFDMETLAFQLTMPGIDEEIMFRGLLLGLLTTALRNEISFLGNPGVWLTAILFGFMHALTLNKDYSINFEPIYFIQTGLGGFFWGLITIRSRSILLAILSHNFSNFFSALLTMNK